MSSDTLMLFYAEAQRVEKGRSFLQNELVSFGGETDQLGQVYLSRAGVAKIYLRASLVYPG
jgi:hypothetical protein